MIKNCLFVLLLAVAISGCGKKTAAKSGEATLEELNQVLSVMSMGASHPPINVNQLTNFPTLRGKTLPQPPPGKKLIIDPATKSVVFVSQ
ncbi:MAG: hypothetical protein WCH99_14260 [Verrucomicrobiota bacterium]